MKLRLCVSIMALTLCVVSGASLADNNKSPATPNATGSPAEVQLLWLSINSGGATEQSSTNFAAGLSCGQAVSGRCQSINYQVNFGFWQVGVTAPTDVQEIVTEELPTTYSLSQNYPNPFNPSTVIEFAVPSRGHVELSVYNLLGQRVVTLVDEPMSQGAYRTVWYGRDESGHLVATGIYFYRFLAGEFKETKKMVLLK